MILDFHVIIIQPGGFFFNNKGEKLILPTSIGEQAILKNHIPMISILKKGLLKVYTKTKIFSFFIKGGVVLIKQNKIIILVNEIYKIDSL